MKPVPLSPEEAAGEITALIAQLHETGRRLEELTAGEIDTVSDALGRPFVLQRAQEALRNSEGIRQSAILDALPAHIALLDAEGTVISVNEGWRRFADENGLQGPAYGIGLNYLAICHSAARGEPSGGGAAAEAIRIALAGGTGPSVEYPCHSPVEKRWFLMTARPLSTERLGGAVVMHSNITERKLRAEEAERAVQRLNEAQRIGQIGDWEWNMATQEIHWSPQVFAIFGRDPALGPPRDHLQHNAMYEPASQLLLLQGVARAIETRTPQDYELRLHRPNGEEVDVLGRAAPRTDEGGRVVGLYGTLQDITERKRSEAAVKEGERRYRSLFENMLEGYAYCETVFEGDTLSDFIYLEVNTAFTTLTGLRDVVGRRVSEIVPGFLDASRDLLELYGRVALTGRPEKCETYMQGLGLWLSITAYSTDRRHFVAVFDNITERKTTQERIIHLSRVQAMLSGISTLIVRVRDQDDLFQEACRIAVDAGGFRMSLMAVVDPEQDRLVAVASGGKDEGLLKAIDSLLATPSIAPTTMLARAIRTRTAVVSNNAREDPRVLLAHLYTQSAVRSIAVLPLIVSGEAVGALALYSDEVEFFHEEELKVLTELTNDIAFGMSAIRAHAEREQADAALRSSLKDKEALLKEVHHRVKNNMQVITSLLRLEANRIDHPTTRSVLKDMQNRIQAMASLHEAVYRSDNFSQVDLAAYLSRLTTQLARSLATDPGQVSFSLELFSVSLDLNQAIPCGLIVNELVSNALKHAFPDGRAGEVRIELKRMGEESLRLRVTDNGVGLPEGFDGIRAKSLGLQLVGDLARQLGGSLQVGPGPEALFDVTFSPTHE